MKAGFLGGWIVIHLLQRGEDPKRIRILDIRPPQRSDLRQGAALEVDFVQVDITNSQSVDAAFSKPWSASLSDVPGEHPPEITVFHTAATIRFYERHPSLLPLSENVNLKGTQNVVEASRRIGVSALVYTSSGSVGVKRTRFWLWPWEKEPNLFTQVINDDEDQLPRRHDQFFSNYAISKLKAERYVRKADRTRSGSGVIRVGCLRPGNGVFGPGGDLLVSWLLTKQINPTWIPTIMQSFTYVENCSLAHLLYEERLIDIQKGTTNPDIGGQAFCIADSGPTPTYEDIYKALSLLSNGQSTFVYLSPSLLLAISHLVEAYYLTRHFLIIAATPTLSWLGRLLPPVEGEIIFLQPSIFALTNVHLIFDDSRARAPPEKGGLGYGNSCTTMDGVCKVNIEHVKGVGQGSKRVFKYDEPALAFDLAGPERAVAEIVEKISGGLRVDATKVLN